MMVRRVSCMPSSLVMRKKLSLMQLKITIGCLLLAEASLRRFRSSGRMMGLRRRSLLMVILTPLSTLLVTGDIVAPIFLRRGQIGRVLNGPIRPSKAFNRFLILYCQHVSNRTRESLLSGNTGRIDQTNQGRNRRGG